MIAPLKDADVDIFFVLAVDYYHRYNGQNGGRRGCGSPQASTEEDLHEDSGYKQNGQAVSIRFEDFVGRQYRHSIERVGGI